MKIKLTIFFSVFLFNTIFFSVSASAGYYTESAVLSTNLLSGKGDVAQITTFKAIITMPAGTAVSVSYSQDGVVWRDSNGARNSWDALSDGANSIDIRALDWTTAYFYYKMKFTNTDQTATAVISQIEVEYSDTYTSYTPPWDGGYYTESAVLSTNLLSGKGDVAQITTFKAIITMPAGTAVSVSYSQDGVVWRDSNGARNSWDALSDGANSIDIRALDWTTAYFYYKMKFTNTDQTATAVISQVEVEYSDTYTPYTPPWDGGYYLQGSMVSTDLLSGTGWNITSKNHFGYIISSLPANTHIYAQFSTDNTNWYGSDGTLWGEDELSLGDHASLDTALSLSALNWIGAASFYYKLKLTATAETTPIVTQAGLVDSVATIVSGGSATTVNAGLTSKMTEGLVLMQSFDGNHMDWNEFAAEARDQSGQDKHGNVIGATAAIGKIGQALDFNGTSGYVSQGNVSAGIQSIAFWIKADDLTSRKIIDIDGTDQIETDETGNILATSFPGTTVIYIDGAVSSALTAGWHHIVITDTTGVNASAMDIGRVSSDYFDGELDEIRLYTRVLSSDETGDLYRMGRVTFRK